MNAYTVISFLLVSLMMLGSSPTSGQTFQYSRGWTNGKRAGASSMSEMRLVDELLSNPCQVERLRYVLQGKPVTEKMMAACEMGNLDSSETRHFGSN